MEVNEGSKVTLITSMEDLVEENSREENMDKKRK